MRSLFIFLVAAAAAFAQAPQSLTMPQVGTPTYDCQDTTGSTTVYTCPTPTPVPTAYAAGMVVTFVPQTTNTTTGPTLNMATLGAINLKATASTNLAIGALVGGKPYTFEFDGTQFVFIGPPTLPLTILNGGTGTASTLTGLVRGNAAAMTAAELSADVTTSGSNAATVVALNGTNLGGLTTGLLKNTTATGVPSIVPINAASGAVVLDASSNAVVAGSIAAGASVNANAAAGDLSAKRSSTTGYVWFGNGALDYLGDDGSNGNGVLKTGVNQLLVTSGTQNILGGHLSAVTTTSMAINLGATLTLGGSYTGTTPTNFMAISGLKENGTDANFAGRMVLSTRPAGGSLTDRVDLSSTGNVRAINGSRWGSTQTTAPTLTAGCNGAGSSVAANSTDNAGTFTTQTAAVTTCTLTFNGTYSVGPTCVFTDGAASITPVAFSAGAVTTTTAIVDFVSAANKVINYICMGH